MRLFQDKKFYRLIVSLALPIALQDLVKYSLNLADNVMIGALSETEISAVSLANQPFFLFSMAMFGLASGGAVLITQYYGKGDMRSVNHAVSITLLISLGITAIVATLVLVFPSAVMSVFTKEDAIIEGGVAYLRIVGWTYILFGISNTMIMIMRNVQVVRPTLLINFVSFLINVFLNWVLIYGNLGAPALGIRGAAIATLIARVAECVAVVIYIRFFEKKLCFRFKNLLAPDRRMARDFFRYSAPVLLNELAWGLGTSMISVVLGRIGEGAVSAASIASSVQQVMTVVLFGIASAACVIIGNAVGAGKADYAKTCARRLIGISVTIGALMGGLMCLLREPILSLYNITPDTHALAMSVMLIAAAVVFLDSLCLVSIAGILRGGGDTRYAMAVDLGTLWLFAVPLGWIFGLWLSLPTWLVYLALRSDVLIKIVLCACRVFRGKWIHNLTEDASTRVGITT